MFININVTDIWLVIKSDEFILGSRNKIDALNTADHESQKKKNFTHFVRDLW